VKNLRSSLEVSSTPPSGTKVCPVCDSSIDAKARRCPSCQTDLSLFDVGGGTVDLGMGGDKAIDQMLDTITGGAEGSEILETLKSVGKASRSTTGVSGLKAATALERREPSRAAGGFMCPICESSVDADATVCPGCGAHFEEGGAAEFECPVCKAAVPRDAERCMTCGVTFAPSTRTVPGPGTAAAPTVPARHADDPRAALQGALRDRLAAVRASRPPVALPLADRKALHRDLPKLVNDVRSLLAVARKIGLPVESARSKINEAIGAGKRREIEGAIKMIGEARQGLERAFRDHIAGQIDSVLQDVERMGGSEDASNALEGVRVAIGRLEAREYEAAWDALQVAAEACEAQVKPYREAKESIAEDKRLLAEARSLDVHAAEIERLLRQGQEALTARKDEDALRFARQAHARLTRDLSVVLHDELRKARQTLLDLKVRGADLSKPIGFLKAASVHVKKEDWHEALRYLQEFRRETGGLDARRAGFSG